MEDFVSAPWLRRLLTVVLLAGIVLLGFRVLEPFIVPLVWAAILAFVTWPAYQWLLRACGGRSLPAALIMTSAVSIAVVAPLAWVAAVLRVELIHAWHETQALLAGGAGAAAGGRRGCRGSASRCVTWWRAPPRTRTRSAPRSARSPTSPSTRSRT